MIRKSMWRLLNEHPPALVRLLARRVTKGKRVEVISLSEIVIASGLSRARVTEISNSMTWNSVTFYEAERFIAACNFDPLSAADRNRKRAYETSCKTRSPKSKFQYLKQSPAWKTEFLPLIERLKSRKAS